MTSPVVPPIDPPLWEPARALSRLAALGSAFARAPKLYLQLWLYVVFFLSGSAALVYQLIWQRVLFTIYGIDIASVTIVVTVFMLGLGIGSLIGGVLSRRAPESALMLFGGFELGIGLFGFFSIEIISSVGALTLGIGHVTTAIVTFLLVLIPTTMMGGTLPLLVAYVTRRRADVGRSVSSLYFFNTLGAAGGCFAAVWVLFPELGLATTARLVGLLNVGLALAMAVLSRIDEDADA